MAGLDVRIEGRLPTPSIIAGMTQAESGSFGHMAIAYGNTRRCYMVFGGDWKVTEDMASGINWHELAPSIKEARKSYAMGLALLMARRMQRYD